MFPKKSGQNLLFFSLVYDDKNVLLHKMFDGRAYKYSFKEIRFTDYSYE